MSVNAPKDSSVDIRLPAVPEYAGEPQLYRELLTIYVAIKSLQAAHTALRVEYDAYVLAHP